MSDSGFVPSPRTRKDRPFDLQGGSSELFFFCCFRTFARSLGTVVRDVTSPFPVVPSLLIRRTKMLPVSRTAPVVFSTVSRVSIQWARPISTRMRRQKCPLLPVSASTRLRNIQHHQYPPASGCKIRSITSIHQCEMRNYGAPRDTGHHGNLQWPYWLGSNGEHPCKSGSYDIHVFSERMTIH